MKGVPLTGTGALCLAMTACNTTASKNESEERDAVTALADRLAIRDLTTRYSHLGTGAQGNFGDFFTPKEGIFEVNGGVYKGKAGIVGLYVGMRGRRQPVPERP